MTGAASSSTRQVLQVAAEEHMHPPDFLMPRTHGRTAPHQQIWTRLFSFQKRRSLQLGERVKITGRENPRCDPFILLLQLAFACLAQARALLFSSAWSSNTGRSFQFTDSRGRCALLQKRNGEGTRDPRPWEGRIEWESLWREATSPRTRARRGPKPPA
jgi:hypothetical protein